MMSEPLYAGEGQLGAHWNALAHEFAGKLEISRDAIEISNIIVDSTRIASLGGTVARTANRLRGQPTLVVPFRPVTSEWEAWLGYREVWSPAQNRQFCFGSSDITVFLAPVSTEAFQQVLRAEWVGLLRGGDGNWAFAPPDAGHPHWQVDVAETLREDEELASARSLLNQTEPRDFEDTEVAERTLPPWYGVGRMHLASAMRPWADAKIAHGPGDVGHIKNWVSETIRVIGLELDRL
jgi:hypothetical protein